ncbi:MAG TPA: ribonuclease HII [Deltaproteobacteria bacterium]|nr:ribonuclease HII [Deltaproteobacteria bacterium]
MISDYYEQYALNRGYRFIAGVDEAGRGPLAGPVVAAAVIFPFDLNSGSEYLLGLGINDSKKLSPRKREAISVNIFRNAISTGLGIVWTNGIEQFNIHVAAHKAMISAVSKLMPAPDFLLIDGPFKLSCNIEQIPVIKGDSLSVSVAAASIVAKVARDKIMDGYNRIFSAYGFDKNRGYGTPLHLEAIKKHGHSSIHRVSFKGVREYV